MASTGGDPASTINGAANSEGLHGKVLSQYAVLWNKPRDNKLLVLQFPNRKRSQPYKDAYSQKPLEIRIKPHAGLVEIDVPVHSQMLYDKTKGVLFGRALKKSKVLEGGGSYGLAGGFGVSALGRPRPKRQAEGEEESEETDAENWEEMQKKGYVLDRMTLGGGMKVLGEGDPGYAIGVFKGDQLHLTKVGAVCSLQPLPHYLDALADLQRTNTRAQRNGPSQEPEARAVNLAVKSTDDDELEVGEIGKRLREMQEEPWQRLEWVDQDDNRAFAVYSNKLVLKDNALGHPLASAILRQQYLEAISAPRVDPTAIGEKVLKVKRETPVADEGYEESTDAEEEEEVMAEVAVQENMEGVQ